MLTSYSRPSVCPSVVMAQFLFLSSSSSSSSDSSQLSDCQYAAVQCSPTVLVTSAVQFPTPASVSSPLCSPSPHVYDNPAPRSRCVSVSALAAWSTPGNGPHGCTASTTTTDDKVSLSLTVNHHPRSVNNLHQPPPNTTHQ